MPLITKISPQKSKKRVNVHLDEEFGFGLDLETYMKSGLKVGGELSDEQIETLVGESEYKVNLDKLYNYAMLRPRSENEIDNWFKRKKVNESARPRLIEKLNKHDLYGDERFARWWVKQRLEFKSKSKRELEKELRSKGIKKDTIDNTLAEFEFDDISSAKKLLVKNSYKWLKFDERIARKKKSEYLLRKGFRWDDIKRAIDDSEQMN
ncbi:RecX family transcriptional regulator [Patescibacteria group bacterium]